MRLEEYLRFHELLGDKIQWIGNVPLGRYRRWFYVTLPRFRRYPLTPQQLRPLALRGALGVIGMTDGPAAHTIQFMVARGPGYDFPRLSSKNRRTQTHQGIKRCTIRRIPWDEMARVGLVVNQDALRRQRRRRSFLEDPEWWERQCRASAPFPDVLAWGAYVNNELASYVHVVIHDWTESDGQVHRVGDIVHFMSGSTHLRDHPNEALIFTVTRDLTTALRCEAVVMGTRSDDPSLFEWKIRMGFHPEETPYHIVVNPCLHVAKFFVPKLRLWIDGSQSTIPCETNSQDHTMSHPGALSVPSGGAHAH